MFELRLIQSNSYLKFLHESYKQDPFIPIIVDTDFKATIGGESAYDYVNREIKLDFKKRAWNLGESLLYVASACVLTVAGNAFMEAGRHVGYKISRQQWEISFLERIPGLESPQYIQLGDDKTKIRGVIELGGVMLILGVGLGICSTISALSDTLLLIENRWHRFWLRREKYIQHQHLLK